jgi:hypothetical protein
VSTNVDTAADVRRDFPSDSRNSNAWLQLEMMDLINSELRPRVHSSCACAHVRIRVQMRALGGYLQAWAILSNSCALQSRGCGRAGPRAPFQQLTLLRGHLL